MAILFSGLLCAGSAMAATTPKPAVAPTDDAGAPLAKDAQPDTLSKNDQYKEALFKCNELSGAERKACRRDARAAYKQGKSARSSNRL